MKTGFKETYKPFAWLNEALPQDLPALSRPKPHGGAPKVQPGQAEDLWHYIIKPSKGSFCRSRLFPPGFPFSAVYFPLGNGLVSNYSRWRYLSCLTYLIFDSSQIALFGTSTARCPCHSSGLKDFGTATALRRLLGLIFFENRQKKHRCRKIW